MQLKTIGESINVINTINQVIKANNHLGNGLLDTAIMSHKLSEATKGYSIESIKAAIVQTTLNEEEIKAILTKKGLEGETLKVTTAELAQVTSTNALNASQKSATISTVGFGTAIKGLGASIKTLALAHPIMTAIAAVGATIGIVDLLTESYEEYAEKQDEIREKTNQTLSDSSSEYENLKSELESVNNELGETANRMKELANQESLTFTEQTELNKLITTNNELKTQKELLENNLKLKQRDRAYDAKDVLQTEGTYTYAMVGYKEGEYVVADSSEYDNAVGTYEDQAKKYIELIQNAKTDIDNSEKFLLENQDKLTTEDYNKELDNITRAKEVLDRNKANASTLISTIQDNLSYLTDDNGKPLEGFEDIYNSYNKVLNNLQSSIDTSNFMSIVKNVGNSNGLDIDSIIEEIYRESFYNHGTGEKVDLSKINSDLFNNLLESGLTEDVIMADIQEVQESFDIAYDTVLDKYKSKGTDFRHSIDNYIRENPIDFQMMYSYDENFTLLDKYIEAEKKKAENTTDYVGDYVINALGCVYKEVKAQVDNSNNFTSFEDAFNAANFADSKEKLLELAKSGEITADVIESTAEYKTLLTQTKLSAEEVKLKILDMLTATEKLSAASKGMDSLSTAFNEWQDKGFVTADTLEALPDVFKELEGYDLFSQIVGDPTNSEAQIQQAFNDFVTEYLKTQGTLDKVTKENTESYIANLKDMGISNADEVVEKYAKFNTLLSDAYEEWTSHLNDDEQAFNAYLSETDTKNVELMNAFGDEYSTDYQNWLDLLQKKKDAYNTYRSAIEGTLVQTPDEAKGSNKLWAKTDQIVNKNLANISYAEYENQDKKTKELVDEYSVKLASTKFTSNSLDYTGSKDSSSSSSSKDTSQTYDWIETKINRLNDALDSIKTKADNVYSSWTERNTELANAISNTKKAIDLQSQAYSRYIQEANSVGLSPTYKELVEIGAIDINTISDETLKEKISDYQTWYDKAQECLKTQDDLNAELNELNTQKFDNIKSEYDDIINRMQSAYDLLESQITLLSSSGDYDTLRNEQTDIVNKLQSERNALQNNLNSSNIQQYTEQWYNLISQLDDLDSQILDAENKLKDIDNLQFDNLKEAFDFDTSVLEHGLQTIQNKIDLLELKGQFANESYYNGMIEYTQQQLDTLKNERTQLQGMLNNTLYKQGTSEWNNMYSTLMDIDEEIDSMTNNLTEYNNAIRDLNWEIFEYLEESLNRITDETDYLVELLSKKDLFDENGQITNYGTTSMALHAAAYDVYKQQAQDYYEEVQDLQKQLVNGAGEEVLAQYNDMVKAHQDAVLAAEDEKQAILDLIEDGYNAQLDALQRLIDKKKEQLNAEKNLYDYQKSIAEKADNISSLEKQKLAYEGDTSEEAMSKIQQIKVQLEEAKADLKESEYEQYLSDTETMLDQLAEDYETWMNERLDHSDELIAQVIGKIALQSDTIKATLKETSDYYGTFISDSLNTIFNSDSPFTQSLTGGMNNVANSLNSGLGGVSTSIAGTTTAINNLVSQVANLVNVETSKTNADSNVAVNNNGTNNTDSSNNSSNVTSGNTVVNKPSTDISNTNKNTTTTGNSPTSNTTSSSTSSSSNTAKTDNSLLDSILINKKDYYPKGSLNIDTSIVDRLKYNDKDSSFSARATYWSKIFGGTYTGSPSQNTKLLNYLKSNGYKSGTSNAVKGNHWTQEDGGEIIYRTSDGAVLTPLGQGDMVFDNESSKRLWELANNPEAFIKKYNISSSIISAMVPQHILNSALPDFCSAEKSYSSQNMSVGDINVNMELPNVSDYKDFRNQLIGDSTFEKAMFTSINHALTGKGTPLDKLKHSRS